MASHPIFRFAPSPNGRLHLGHAFSALFAAHWAERLGGTFLLRIEDIDTARCKPEFDVSLRDDLHWLGLTWPEPVMRQSQRFAVYAGVADTLKQMGLLYPCFCSRSQIAAAATAHDPDGAPFYPGTCRHLSERDALLRLTAGEPAQWRLDSRRAISQAGPLTIAETLPDPSAPATHRPAHPEAWGDAVLVRKDTPTSYHLSVVIDDATQGITNVTRGMDLYAATDLHRLLQAILVLPTPLYCHHALITDGADLKLAKSRGSPTLADLRAAGWTPSDIRAAVGL